MERLKAVSADRFDSVRAFYWCLIDEMGGRGNTVGWKKGIYPSDDYLRESLCRGWMYALEDDEGFLACVILNSLWNQGYDGVNWSVDCPREDVIVPHALAVRANAQGKGIGLQVVRSIIGIAKNSGKKTIRLDLLAGNIAAEHLYIKAGFHTVAEKNLFYEDTGLTRFLLYEFVL